jgi:plastocyanin domain-containing protein
MSEIIVIIAGLILTALIIWWFWFSTPKAAHADQDAPVEIMVKDGTYQPAAVEVQAGKPLNLSFTRQDPTPCAEKVVFADFGITADLPLGRSQNISIPALEPGSYEFTCQMGMYRGRLVVK